MLERLEEIDWSALTHAYGSASDVPRMLRDLASSDPGTRQSALWNAYGSIYHQGSVYTATVPAIEFVAEIARESEHADRSDLIEFLAQLGRVARYGDEYEVVRDVAGAVSRHFDLFAAAARSDDPVEKMRGISGLAVCPDLPADLVEELLGTVGGDHRIRIAFYLAAGESLRDAGPLGRAEDDPVVELARLLARARVLGGSIDAVSLNALEDLLTPQNWAVIEAVSSGTGGALSPPHVFLENLATSDRRRLDDELRKLLEASQDADCALELAFWLLDDAFEAPLTPNGEELTVRQRSVLESIARSNAAWVWGGNMSLRLSDLGAPARDREAFAEWLGIDPPAHFCIATPREIPAALDVARRIDRAEWADTPWIFYSGKVDDAFDAGIPEDLEYFTEQVMSDAGQIAGAMSHVVSTHAHKAYTNWRFYPQLNTDSLRAFALRQGWNQHHVPREAPPATVEATESPTSWAELDEDEQALVERFVEHLDHQGWLEARHWFDFVRATEGFAVTPVAFGRWFGTESDVEASIWLNDAVIARATGQRAGDAYVRVQIVTKSRDKAWTLRFYLGTPKEAEERLDKLAAVLSEHYRTMSYENVPTTFMVAAFEHFDPIIVDTGDGNLFAASPANDDRESGD